MMDKLQKTMKKMLKDADEAILSCPHVRLYIKFAQFISDFILTSGAHHIYNVIHQALLDGDIPTDGDCKVFPSKKATKRESMM